MKSNRFSRREFLAIGAGAAGASLVTKTILLDPEPAWAFQGPASPSDRVRFGIIGIGMQGSGLLASAIELPGVECVAACDLYDGRHTLAKEIVRPDLPTTRRYQELLADKNMDCIVAAVPDHWHKQVVVDAVSAGKDIYCEKPMSHTAAEGVEMVAAAKRTGRIVQIGSQRVSSVICAKAKELVNKGVLGDLMLVEGSLGRNDPTGAWEYPPPPDLSPQTLDWDTWQGTVPKRAFDPKIFARWRCWKEYGTGVAGDLLVHLVSGMQYVLGINEAPKRAMAMGGILRWKDGRNMPDVHASLFEYGQVPMYMRLNLGTETPEIYRFQGSKGILELTEFTLTYIPQAGVDTSPSYYAFSFPKALREEYFKKWHQEHDPVPGKEPAFEGVTYRSNSWDDVKPHLWNFFQAVRTRKPVVEDAVFGHNAALACHMANESYFRKSAVSWDAGASTIKS
ncbi:MAG: gfo/Idh/MocA family oxidoreductase [Acidobacteria bacterium]|nr:MAG: oxidoreductase [Acidobacteriales bacterium 13_1_40CM_3_55_5]PYX16453.1 MAG: gfo/Idh/MocA family oxidoreductase [Acidobacteriota bacterium]